MEEMGQFCASTKYGKNRGIDLMENLENFKFIGNFYRNLFLETISKKSKLKF